MWGKLVLRIIALERIPSQKHAVLCKGHAQKNSATPLHSKGPRVSSSHCVITSGLILMKGNSPYAPLMPTSIVEMNLIHLGFPPSASISPMWLRTSP